MEAEGYVVGLERCQGCREVGCAVGMTIPTLHSIGISICINKHLRPRNTRETNAPELQMHHPLHAILRHIVVVEQRVSYARDAEEQDARRGEEEGAEVGSLGGLGDGGVDGEEGCILDRLVIVLR